MRSIPGQKSPSVLLVGGGIGGMAAAIALAHQGVCVELLEQSSTIGEVGAGLQLGPNAFAALDALGVGASVRQHAVFADSLVMLDAVDCSEIAAIHVGADFRQRFANPYAVTHRADLHRALLEAVHLNPKVRLYTSARVDAIDINSCGVMVTTDDGRRFSADAIVGCDGVRSVVREHLIHDSPRVSGHVVYRALVPTAAMPADLRLNSPVVWAGPDCHLVHYPLRHGEQFNLVVTFHSRKLEEWGVSHGSKDEVLSYFEGIHARPRQLLDLPTSWWRWSTADRDPIAHWSHGQATLLGDAAHPMMQYLAEGACMALEDAVTLGQAVQACDLDLPAAFKLYQDARIARTGRVVLSVREMGRIYHAKGVERLVRNSLWAGRTQVRFYDSLEWLFAWRPERCLDDATKFYRPALASL
ncbi:3-hydroxybenzoate 6-monooxygenase [Variovorax sp. ZS18.2.2]|uniref:3-hydroxybenzoate 6-monooxygenase n=1 Tax=Variovorax sp. ZS18.2.2 TaxID=2971255 RepID=UPI00215098F3|nr:3-hydroxybenzoate 6-monooxygenase [Variovorax sp. ZS18.2.2]MCR6480972.1 3-hydroxybenzoate 6-monooxygenase [Variovorax sp. ZS18.2.2]